MGVRVAVSNFFFYQSIGIDETNTFPFEFFISLENCGRHRFGGLVGVKGAWQTYFWSIYRYISVKIFILASKL